MVSVLVSVAFRIVQASKAHARPREGRETLPTTRAAANGVERVDSPWSIAAEWVGAAATTAAVIVALWISHRDARRVDRERRDAEKGQARLVTVEAPWGSGGGVTITVTNRSLQPIFGLELDSVTNIDDPELAWRIPPTIHGARQSIDVLGAGEPWTTYAEFLDANGQRDRLRPGASIAVDISFHDASGLTWRKRTNSDPVRVITEDPRTHWWTQVRRRVGRAIAGDG